VKQFIREDVPHYKDVEFKAIPGHNPDLVLLSEGDEEIERIDLSEKNREQCNDLLKEKGFQQITEELKTEL